MTESKRENIQRRIIQVIFAVYILVLFRFTIFKYAPLFSLWEGFFLRVRELNIIPFKATLEMIQGLSPLRLIENLAGNIILFVPFGIVFPLAFKAEKRTIFFGCITSVFIEIMQLSFAMGAADIDDVIFNTVGTVIGYALYRIICLCIKDKAKLMTAMTVVLGTGLAAGLIVLYYAGYLINGFPNITF